MKPLIAVLLIMALSHALQGQNKQEKKAAEAQAYLDLKELVATGVFTFSADWATTQQGNRINLQGNPNSLKFTEDKIIADLPFFGVTQVPSTDGRGGIYFEVEKPEIKTDFNDKKQRIELNFIGKNKTESLSCTLSLFKNNTARLQIFSSSRNAITYDGRLLNPEPDK